MATTRVLTTSRDREAWDALVAASHRHDVYHLGGYHLLSESLGQGVPHLFVYEDADGWIALPLLVRSLEDVESLSSSGRGLYDATSVYGYPGPVASGDALPARTVAGFQAALKEWLCTAGIVCVFSRLHPLIEQTRMLVGIGEIVDAGTTVSIDLTLPLDEQVERFRKSHRQDIRRALRDGISCCDDEGLEHLDAFAHLYWRTMDRLGASDGYYFSPAYFHGLFDLLRDNVHLFCCYAGTDLACAGLFTICDGFVQYHLSASDEAYQRLAPTKVMIDTVRVWATARGARAFHLGGGVGARDDSLFRFKAGFTDRTHGFHVWRWVVQPDVYAVLCERHRDWCAKHRSEPSNASYFPQYRAPIERQP